MSHQFLPWLLCLNLKIKKDVLTGSFDFLAGMDGHFFPLLELCLIQYADLC